MTKDQKPANGCNNCGSTERLQLSNGEWLCADCRKNIRCRLQEYREEIIKNGLESLPPDIRDAVIDKLFGPEKDRTE